MPSGKKTTYKLKMYESNFHFYLENLRTNVLCVKIDAGEEVLFNFHNKIIPKFRCLCTLELNINRQMIDLKI
jgi:hypothetical protein